MDIRLVQMVPLNLDLNGFVINRFLLHNIIWCAQFRIDAMIDKINNLGLLVSFNVSATVNIVQKSKLILLHFTNILLR